MPLFNRTPEKYESRALGYERRGKTAKAIKNREKAAQLRAKHSGLPLNSGLPMTSTTGRTSPILMSGLPVSSGLTSTPILGSGMNSGLPLNNGLPLNQGLQTGLPLNSGLPLNQGLQTGIPLNSGLNSGLPLNNGLPLNQGLQTGLPLNSGLMGNQWSGNNIDWANWSSTRSPAMYERNALKWEQRGNWNKAQKNREKFWRLQNPQFNSFAAPNFYQNNQFMGYNLAHQGPLSLQKTGLPLNQGLQTGLPLGQQGMAPTFAQPIVEQHVRPAIVEQTMRPEKIVEIQPIVHREIEAPQVKVIEKHVYETVPSAGPSTHTNAPIIQEVVKPRIIEEIQPVVHRQVPAPFVERVEQHVTEHIVKPTTTTKEIQQGGIAQQPFVAAGGAPMMQQTTTTSTTTQPGLMGKLNNALHRN